MAMPGGAQETLDNIPTHVWKGLPDSMKLKPSRVNEKRIGVWASKLIPKGKRFGPFIGERKKRSQVTSNVYMWEVYFPTRGWMCVDATDPMKGNWLRYVNWARSSQEQNLFPLEINRSIYYKVLRPIGPNEELLVLYNGEDNPEIAAALEEERASSSGKKSSPRSRRAKKKLLEKVGQAAVGFCGSRHNQTYCESVGTKPTATKMRDSEEGLNESNENLQPSSDQVKESVLSVEPPIMVNKDSSFLNVLSEGMRQDGEEDCDEEEPELKLSHESSQSNTEAKPEDKNELQIQHLFQSSDAVDSSANHLCETEGNSSEYKFELEADPTFDDDPQAETHHCQHCERHFSTKQGLERHIHIHTITNHEPHTFKCRYCAKPFGSQVGRRRHERRHESGLKKKPGSLAGTAVIINSSVFNDSQSSVSVNPASHIILGTQNGAFPQSSDGLKKDPSSFGTDENGESKELHVCKYCKKAFGTHTNMRRHQRRIHERHLMPKGVRRKGILLQEVRSQLEQQQDQCLTPQEARGSPPPVYVPSVDTEDEGEREEYMVDISKNISENLNLYLDGKILSTNSGSNCEVIEVDSRSAALFGLDAVIISPDQIKQAIKFDTRSSLMKDVTGADQAGPKRRTSTPPLMPTAKMEPETISSAASLSSTSSQSPLLVGNILPQSAETLAFQKEKPIYLSPKLKQLLQNQDSQKSTIALIADRHRLTTPCTVPSLPAATGRFKRRTTSPPTSLQSSSSVMTENSLKETEVSFTLKVPRVESHSMSSAWSLSNKDQKDPSGSPGEGIFQVWPDSRSGGSSCNQQPLDLSNTDGKRNGNSMKESGESVLDLSLHRKSMVDPETRGSLSIHPHTKKKKPNTSMLEKVLMNEYAGLSPTGEESSSPDGCLGSHSPSSTVGNSPHSMCHKTEKGSGASVHPPSPPPLTPVTLNTSSPSSSPGSSTPPPPVLPTVVSPPPLSSQNAQSSDSLALCSSPELPPKMSPCPLEHSEEEILVSHNHDDNIESCPAAIIPIKREMDQTAAHLDTYNHAPLSSPLDVKGESIADSLSNPETLLEDSTDLKTNLSDNVHDLSSRKDNSDCSPLLGHVSSESETSSAIFSSTASNLDNQCLQMPEQRKEEPTQRAVSSECVSPSISLVAPDEITDEAEMSEPDTFAKNFVCNVCEDPFRSIKELSHHITNHVAEWPYKCEFCVQLFRNTSALLEHRSALHGVGRIYVCSICSKEFAFLCNLQQHQKDLHPGQAYTHSVVENGKLRPQNYTDSAQANGDNNLSNIASGSAMKDTPQSVTGDLGENDDNKDDVQDDKEPEDPTEELYTTIKIMASEAGKPKGPDVRLGLNQHYPSFKPPPFPYHNRTPAGSVASATNFTTHNIPQTFSTAIRCTKCGNSFDNMPELHKHILACANASDKRRYTPKKNPIPLRQIAKPQNGALVPKAPASNGQHVFHRVGHPKRLNFSQELPSRMKMTSLNKKKNQLVQKAISQKNKTSASAKKVSGQADEEQEVHVCPHCNREFTYPASLTKHIACSCPMKPLPKTSKKVAPVSQDKNMKLRSRSTNAEIKQEPDLGLNFKTLGKTRSRSLEPAESDSSISSKAKPMVSQMRMKRGASNLDNTIPQGKKSKKGSGQHPSESPHHAALDDASQRSAMKLQSKEVGPKKVIEGKSQQSHNQPKKEERFSLRTRERIGGPVTRSLQMASATASVEVKTEDFTSHEQRESQETLSKLAR